MENFPPKTDRYDNKCLGAIGKREYENDVVGITLQALLFKWKKVSIPKVKGYGIELMSIFYAYNNHREIVFKPDTVKDEEKTKTYVPIFVMLPAILGPIFCGEEKKSWKLHLIVKGWLDPKDREMKRIVCPIIE